MIDFSSLFEFAISVIGPVVLLIAFGYLLFKQGLMHDDFVERATRLIFNFALPALLFTTISKSELARISDATTIGVGISGTLLFFVLALILAPLLVPKRLDRGVVIQGTFRSNMGIIGLAYCHNAYGDEGLAFAAVYLGGITILYNVLSVAVLSIYNGGQYSLAKILRSIATNPLILSIVLALLFAYFQLEIPAIVQNSVDYFAQLTLPLALLCTGAALRFNDFRNEAKATGISIIGKCLLYPSLLVVMAIYMDISGMALGVVFLMAACPTAAASYVMVRKIGGNHILAAHIVAFSTIISVPCTVLGYALIQPWLS